MTIDRLILILATITAFTACGQSETNEKPAQQKGASADYVLTDSSAGPFVIGNVLPDSNSTFTLRKVQRRGLEGPPPQTVYHISKNGTELMAIIPQYDGETQTYTNRIVEIIVSSKRYRTKANIGSGSTIEAFTAAYPEYEVWYTYVSDRFILEAPRHENMQFLLRAEDFTGTLNPKNEITPLTLNDFRDSATIRAVRIY